MAPVTRREKGDVVSVISGSMGRRAVAAVGPLVLAAVAIAVLRSDAQPALAAGKCPAARFDADRLPGACWRPFSARSPFNRLLPDSPMQAPDSARIVATITGWGNSVRFSAGNADTGDDFDHPFYFSSPGNPVFRVHCTMSWGTCPIEGDRVRIPNLARPAAGEDGHLGVIDARRGWEYDFWQVREKPLGGGLLSVSWGGRTPIASRRARGLGAGATASGFALSAGVIRPPELRKGLIDHALFMTVDCTNGNSVAPGSSNPGRSCSSVGRPTSGAPSMGQHFYLDMSQPEIDALPLARWKKTVLTAMADYGMFVGDTGGSGWRIKIQSGTSYTSLGFDDPWVTLARRIGLPASRAPDGLDRFQFDMSDAVDWASELSVAAPCVSRGGC